MTKHIILNDKEVKQIKESYFIEYEDLIICDMDYFYRFLKDPK